MSDEETKRRDALNDLNKAMLAIWTLKYDIEDLEADLAAEYKKTQDAMTTLDIRVFKSPDTGLMAVVMKNPPSRRMNYALLLKEYPQQYDALILQEVLTVTQPKSPTKLEIRKLKETIVDAETGERIA